MSLVVDILLHTELASQVLKVLDTTTCVTNSVYCQTFKLIQAINDAIENKSGHTVGAKLELQSTDLRAVDEPLNEVRKEFARATDGRSSAAVGVGVNSVDAAPSANGRASPMHSTFVHDGNLFAIPKNFQFLKPKSKEAVRFWLCGQ